MFSFHRAVAAAVELEKTKLKLQAVCRPEHYLGLLELAETRLKESRRRARYLPVSELTQQEALDSVLEDVIYGRITHKTKLPNNKENDERS